MNLHLFEVALLIHAKEAWENFEGVGWGGIKKKKPQQAHGLFDLVMSSCSCSACGNYTVVQVPSSLGAHID